MRGSCSECKFLLIFLVSIAPDLIAHQQFSFYDESVQSQIATKSRTSGAKLMVSEAKGGDSTGRGDLQPDT
jgi:hypothetical protein